MDVRYTTTRFLGARAVCLVALFLLFGPLSLTWGQQESGWATKMFSQVGTSLVHDFGNVALHAESEHRFVFENFYREEVEIESVSSSCSCTKPSFTKKIVKSGEKSEIIARVDTSGKVHTGKRKATIKVRFSRPIPAEVQLQINAFIRSDVMIDPGVIEFGAVGKGENSSQTVYLQYNGSLAGWTLTGLKKTNPGIKAVAKEVARRGGRKTYEVTVTLKDTAEPGYLTDLLRFMTNDAQGQSIFLPIHGLVLAPLTAKPSYFQLGIIHPGEQVAKNLVIRGSVPFQIEKITSTDPRMKFLTANQTSSIHVVPVTFRADDGQGPVHQTISIKTTQKEVPELDISVYGFISKKSSSGGKSAESSPQEPAAEKTTPDIKSSRRADRKDPLEKERQSDSPTDDDRAVSVTSGKPSPRLPVTSPSSKKVTSSATVPDQSWTARASSRSGSLLTASKPTEETSKIDLLKNSLKQSPAPLAAEPFELDEKSAVPESRPLPTVPDVKVESLTIKEPPDEKATAKSDNKKSDDPQQEEPPIASSDGWTAAKDVFQSLPTSGDNAELAKEEKKTGEEKTAQPGTTALERTDLIQTASTPSAEKTNNEESAPASLVFRKPGWAADRSVSSLSATSTNNSAETWKSPALKMAQLPKTTLSVSAAAQSDAVRNATAATMRNIGRSTSLPSSVKKTESAPKESEPLLILPEE